MTYKRIIPNYIEVIKSKHNDFWNCSYAIHIGYAREEIKHLREYVKELETMLDESTRTAQEVTKQKKICSNKVNGSCQMHNLQCGFPDCEK